MWMIRMKSQKESRPIFLSLFFPSQIACMYTVFSNELQLWISVAFCEWRIYKPRYYGPDLALVLLPYASRRKEIRGSISVYHDLFLISQWYAFNFAASKEVLFSFVKVRSLWPLQITCNVSWTAFTSPSDALVLLFSRTHEIGIDRR